MAPCKLLLQQVLGGEGASKKNGMQVADGQLVRVLGRLKVLLDNQHTVGEQVVAEQLLVALGNEHGGRRYKLLSNFAFFSFSCQSNRDNEVMLSSSRRQPAKLALPSEPLADNQGSFPSPPPFPLRPAFGAAEGGASFAGLGPRSREGWLLFAKPQ